MSVSLPRRQDPVIYPPPPVFSLPLLTPMFVFCCQLQRSIKHSVRFMRSQLISLSSGVRSSRSVLRAHTFLPSLKSMQNCKGLTKYQAYKHKLQSPTANCPKTHTPTHSPILRSCISRPEEFQKASRMVDHSGSRVKLCLAKGARKRLAGEWRRGCEPLRGVAVENIALDVRRGGRSV